MPRPLRARGLASARPSGGYERTAGTTRCVRGYARRRVDRGRPSAASSGSRSRASTDSSTCR
jgi:hypothetical protein